MAWPRSVFIDKPQRLKLKFASAQQRYFKTCNANSRSNLFMQNSDDGQREASHAAAASVRKALTDFLRTRSKKARFVTEIYAAMSRLSIGTKQTDRALADLEREGVVMMRDHFCADPHLAGVDLRIVALVQSIEGMDAQLSAIHTIDAAWNKWLSEYLANHRCG